MGKNKRTYRAFKNAINTIKENSQTIAKNTVHTNEKLDNIKNNTDIIKQSCTSKLPRIISIISLLVTISGISIIGIIDRLKPIDAVDKSAPGTEYTIYLYPEYSTFDITTKVDMIASLNFEANAVSITAHLASGKEATVPLERKNTTEWQKKVEFEEIGVHEIVVTATAPNGKVIENSTKVEVVPVSIDMGMITQFFSP